MDNKQIIRDFLNQIIILKKEIDSLKTMREQTFFRIDQLELNFDSEIYDDFRLIISEYDNKIAKLEGAIDTLWDKIESLGGLHAIEEILAQDAE